MLLPTAFSLLCIIIALASPAQNIADLIKKNSTASSVCNSVCDDLPEDDLEPVCMMFSRYKKGFQYFVNMCHARRAVCKENLVLHIVHPSRCKMTNQFFLPVV